MGEVVTGERVQTPPRTLGWHPALDGVRGIAIICVVLAHAFIVAPDIVVTPVLSRLSASGFLGVDIFFVLSGFLITALLVSESDQRGRVSLRRFYLRRAARLLPALYVFLAAVWTTGLVTDFRATTAEFQRRTILAALTYTSNIFAERHAEMVGDLGHMWSLAFEEKFYVVWPILLTIIIAWRWTRAHPEFIVAAAIAAVAINRGFVFAERGWYIAYLGSLTRIDGLLVGALAALVWRRGAVPTRLLPTAGTVAAGGLIVGLFTLRGDTALTFYGGLLVFNLCVAVVIVALTESTWSAKRLFEWRPLSTLGRVSYGTYLWHHVVFWETRRSLIRSPGWVQVVVALGVTAIAVAASWWLVERPASRAMRRFLARDAPQSGIGIGDGEMLTERPAPRDARLHGASDDIEPDVAQ